MWLFGSGSGVETELFQYYISCPSKLEGRKRTSEDILVLPAPAIPQLNAWR